MRDTVLAQMNGQADFIRALRAAEKLKASQNLAIVQFKSMPEGTRPEGEEVFSLPPANAFELQVSVMNRGNVRAERIQVKASLTSQINPTPQVTTDEIDVLDPGDTKAVVLRGLKPDKGDPVNLLEMEAVSPDDIDQLDNKKSFEFTMRKS